MKESSSGVGFGGLLALLFIGLKLGGVIAWPWVWVLGPIWIPFVILAVFFAAFGTFVGILALLGYQQNRKRTRTYAFPHGR